MDKYWWDWNIKHTFLTNQKNRPFGLSFWHCLIETNHNFQGFFAVKRRTVFILGAKGKALVRGWRRDCVVGGMETRFQWRKAHSRTAKCDAFQVAPRLFFMFLFLVPFTIRQQWMIYPLKFSTETKFSHFHDKKAPSEGESSWGRIKQL